MFFFERGPVLKYSPGNVFGRTICWALHVGSIGLRYWHLMGEFTFSEGRAERICKDKVSGACLVRSNHSKSRYRQLCDPIPTTQSCNLTRYYSCLWCDPSIWSWDNYHWIEILVHNLITGSCAPRTWTFLRYSIESLKDNCPNMWILGMIMPKIVFRSESCLPSSTGCSLLMLKKRYVGSVGTLCKLKKYWEKGQIQKKRKKEKYINFLNLQGEWRV